MEYQVDLDVFRGPLDLLLYLVKHHEVDIIDIPIARVTEQFIVYLNILKLVDVERVGDFLVMAATLMEIKSKLLLPRADAEDQEQADPRLELVKQLVEYKKFKEAAVLLEARADEQLQRMPRQPSAPPAPLDPSEQPLRTVELWDLVSAFGRLMRETMALAPQQIVMDQTPIHVHMETILARLRSQPEMEFSALFTPPYQRGRLVGLFLAVLELIKGGQILVEQIDLFGTILVRLAPAAAPATVVG